MEFKNKFEGLSDESVFELLEEQGYKKAYETEERDPQQENILIQTCAYKKGDEIDKQPAFVVAHITSIDATTKKVLDSYWDYRVDQK